MDAIVVAGGVPHPDDPLYPFTQGAPKAMLEIAGRPMVQWVLDALQAAQLVDRVVVVGVEAHPELEGTKTCAFLPDQGGILENLRCGTLKVLEFNPQAELVLSVSGDIPAITGEMVDWTIRAAQETVHDIYYCVISREVMDARFSESMRSFVSLQNGDFCGGDLNVFRAALVTSDLSLWERIVAARKNALKQAALIGFDSLLLLLLRRLTIQSAVKRVGKRLGIRGRALICPYAEIAMDVDKPAQLKILHADLASKAAV